MKFGMNSKHRTAPCPQNLAQPRGHFGYLFQDARLARFEEEEARRAYGGGALRGSGAPVWGDFCDFLAGELVAAVNVDPAVEAAFAGFGQAVEAGGAPLPRQQVQAGRRNLATGFLRLSAIYEAGAEAGGIGDGSAAADRWAKTGPALQEIQRRFVETHGRIAHGFADRGADAAFEAARQLNIWQFQYYVVHDVLGHFCDAQALQRAHEERGAFYNAFLQRIARDTDETLPLPFEFCTALRVCCAIAGQRALGLDDLAHDMILALPTGQILSDEVSLVTGQAMPVLSEREMRSGDLGAFFAKSSLATQAPLSAYLLIEAEVHHGGARMGSLGSLILANTLLGIIIRDPQSYWHQKGSGSGGRWQPSDGLAALR